MRVQRNQFKFSSYETGNYMRNLLIILLLNICIFITSHGTGAVIFQVAHAEPSKKEDVPFEALMERANNGDVSAQYKIARKYDKGDGVTEDINEALKWYLRSANKGNAKAQYALGFLYYYNNRVPQDMVKSLKWYEQSASQGNTWAALNLSQIYLIGIEVKKNKKRAIEILTKAAKSGDMTCQERLGMYYYMGEYVPKNIEKAVYWFSKALEQGHPSVKKYLDEINGVKKPITKVVNNKDRNDFAGIYRLKEQIKTDEGDCIEGGYSSKECMCVLTDEYKSLEKMIKHRVDWEGKRLSYTSNRGKTVYMSFDNIKGFVNIYDQTCID